MVKKTVQWDRESRVFCVKPNPINGLSRSFIPLLLKRVSIERVNSVRFLSRQNVERSAGADLDEP